MLNYNKDSYGQKIRVNFSQDISSATNYSMTLLPEVGDSLEKTASLGTSDVLVGDQKFLANEYIEYTIEEGLFDQSDEPDTPSVPKTGLWKVKGIATFANSKLATNYNFFRVMP